VIPRVVLASVVVAVLPALAGCDADRAPAEDHTLLKLRQEEARRQAQAEQVDRLATAAVRPPAETRRTLPVPKQPRLEVGPLQMEVVALTTSQVVEGQKVSLATEDRFLRVQLAVKNTGKVAAAADVSGVRLVGAQQRTWGIARDVQRLAGSAALQAGLAPGESRDFVMFFEVPEAALAGGLSLKVGGAGAAGTSRNEDGVISLD
jgi:hypothetical protein